MQIRDFRESDIDALVGILKANLQYGNPACEGPRQRAAASRFSERTYACGGQVGSIVAHRLLCRSAIQQL